MRSTQGQEIESSCHNSRAAVTKRRCRTDKQRALLTHHSKRRAIKGSIGNDALSNGVPQTAQSELSRTAYVLVLEPFIPTYFLWFPDLAVISTATPAITSEFNSLVDVGWYAWQRSSGIYRCLLTVNLQVWHGVSARQCCSHAANRQALPFVFHQGKLTQEVRASRSRMRILT